MSRIAKCFAQLKHTGRKALIPYITAGDPNPQVTVNLLHTLVSAGADILELGIPFSDPMADGPVIQRACERALANEVSLDDTLSMVNDFRKHDKHTPIVLMGYLNPIEVKGYRHFANAASAAGVDGVLIVDFPPEESVEYTSIIKAKELDPVFLVALTSSHERLEKITAAASGFIYCVALKGVTGSRNLDINAVINKLNIIRRYTDLPLGVGFGVHDAASATQLAPAADAIVVGSALVQLIAEHQQDLAMMDDAVTALLLSLRSAIDEVTTRNNSEVIS